MTTTITAETIVKRLVEGEQGRKIAADILREQQQHRVGLRAQCQALKRERGERKRELTGAVEAAGVKLEAALATMAEAEAEHRRAVIAQMQAGAHYDARIAKLERELTQTAPPEINEFLDWLADQEHATQQTEVVKRARNTDRIRVNNGEYLKEIWTNAAGLQERLKAIRAARAEAETLKPRVLDAADVQQRLDELRDSLPPVEMRYSHEA